MRCQPTRVEPPRSVATPQRLAVIPASVSTTRSRALLPCRSRRALLARLAAVASPVLLGLRMRCRPLSRARVFAKTKVTAWGSTASVSRDRTLGRAAQAAVLPSLARTTSCVSMGPVWSQAASLRARLEPSARIHSTASIPGQMELGSACLRRGQRIGEGSVAKARLRKLPATRGRRVTFTAACGYRTENHFRPLLRGADAISETEGWSLIIEGSAALSVRPERWR